MAHALPPAMTGMSGLVPPDESLPSPDSVSNLILWMWASEGLYTDLGVTPATAEDDIVCSFTNVASISPPPPGQGGDAMPGKRPLLKLAQANGQPALLFDGSDDFFTLAGGGIGVPSPDGTILAVVKATDVSGSPVIIGGTGSWSVGLNAAGKISLAKDAVEFGAGATTLSTSDFSLICATFDAPAGDWAVYLNGVADGSGTSVQVLGNLKSLGAGHEGSAANPFAGYIASVMAYATLLAAPDLAVPTNWMKDHYGLP